MKRKKPYYPPPKLTVLTVREETKLMEFLLKKMSGISRNSVKSLLSHRQISVNDIVTTQFDAPLHLTDRVVINHSSGNVTKLTHSKLRMIYEDSDLVVVEKAEGLLTVTAGSGLETTVFSILKNYLKKSSPANKIYTVHRLDRETSGVLVFAKNRDAQHILRNNWHRIVTQRLYTAVVEGKVTKESGQIVSWLTEHEVSLKIKSSPTDNGGKQAITNYRRKKYNDNYSLLEIELETGRKNQIRVHMESIGHPIVGDRKYGSSVNVGRLALHASVLEFHHPISGDLMRFETPVPEQLLKLVR